MKRYSIVHLLLLLTLLCGGFSSALACQACYNGSSAYNCETCTYVYNSQTGFSDYVCDSHYDSIYYYNYVTLQGNVSDQRTGLPITLAPSRVDVYDAYGYQIGTTIASSNGSYRLDNIYFEDTTNPVNYTICASAGINYPEKCFDKTFYDSYNVCSVSQFQNFVIKATPPKPQALSFSNGTMSSVTVSWSSGGGITQGFNFAYQAGKNYPSCNGTNVGTSTLRSLSNLKAGTQYAFTICAYDQYGTFSNPLNGIFQTPQDPYNYSMTAGRNTYIAEDGLIWNSDSGLYTGSTGTFSWGDAIANTSDSGLYQSTRYGKDFQYNIPMPNGLYFAVLKFAELYFGSANSRIFSLFANGKKILENFDLFAAAGGKNVAYDKYIPVTVSNGSLNLSMSASKDNASINAVQVLAAGSGKSKVGTATFPATPSCWNQYTGQSLINNYQFGVSGLNSLRSWIGYAGVATKQNFSWSGLIPGKVYFVNYYPAFATDSVLYTAAIVSGSASIVVGQNFTPNPPRANGNYYQVPTPWQIIFIANSSNVTLQLGNSETSGYHYMYLDFVEGSNPAIPAFIAAPPVPTSVAITTSTASSLTVGWANAGGTTAGFKVASILGNSTTLGCASGVDVGNTLSYTVPSLQSSSNYTLAICSYNAHGTLSSPVRVVGNTQSQPPPTTGSVLVNAGGAAYVGVNGARWSADSGFSSGSSTYSVSNAITGTVDQTLYKTSRYGGNFTYTTSVPNGLYEVTLKFAEPYVNGIGQRLFNVNLNGQAVLSNFDVFKESGGKYAAIDKSFFVLADSGAITLQFIAVANNAEVSAIQISPATTQRLTIGTPAFPSVAYVWNQYTSGLQSPIYTVGSSGLSDMRSWVGLVSGFMGAQNFTWNNLTVGKSYVLNIYPAFATTSVPYFAEVAQGSAVITSGASFTPPASPSTGNYYNGRLAWQIRFTANSPSMTLKVGRNAQTTGAHYMYLNWAETVKP